MRQWLLAGPDRSRRAGRRVVVTAVALLLGVVGGVARSAAVGDGATEPPRGIKYTRVEPQPGQAGVHPIRWESARVRRDGRTVIVRFVSGVPPCSVLDHVDVDFRPRKVFITLYEGHAPGSEDQACIALAQYKSVKVVLKRRVGGRRIIDGYFRARRAQATASPSPAASPTGGSAGGIPPY